MIGRRHVLAGAAAGLALPARAAIDAVGARLDAAANAAPAAALAMMDGIDARTTTPARRLDLHAARAGLAIDAALADRPDDYTLRLCRTLGDGFTIPAARRRLDAALTGLHARAAALFDAIGVDGATIGDRYVRLFAGEDGRYPADDTGRARAVADMTRTLARLRADTPRLIADVPPFCRDVAVRALTAEEQASGRTGYRIPPAPARPGAYVVDLADLARRPAWSLPGVVAHELLPGHMIQLGIEGVAPPHPLRLRYAAAFVEGWATYAETLAAPGFADPRVLLGHLHWLIFRAARARIDLGVHTERWSQDEARARLARWQGVPVYFAPFARDLARIAAEPGVRAAEALAWLWIADRAPPAPRRWHAALLAHGRRRLDGGIAPPR